MLRRPTTENDTHSQLLVETHGSAFQLFDPVGQTDGPALASQNVHVMLSAPDDDGRASLA